MYMKDSQKIQELVDRYWDGATTPEEENVIRAFYASHDNLSPELEKWRNWFEGEEAISHLSLGSNFDEKILSRIERKETKVKHIRLRRTFLSSAAAVAALMLAYFSWMQIGENRYDSDEMSYAEIQEEYEMVKGMLFFTSSQINRAEAVLDENLKKMEVVNEYIKIK